MGTVDNRVIGLIPHCYLEKVLPPKFTNLALQKNVNPNSLYLFKLGKRFLLNWVETNRHMAVALTHSTPTSNLQRAGTAQPQVPPLTILNSLSTTELYSGDVLTSARESSSNECDIPALKHFVFSFLLKIAKLTRF